jgi:hypothetical protein
MDWPQVIVAVGTWALVGATLWLVHGQLSTAKEQRKLQLYLELRKDLFRPVSGRWVQSWVQGQSPLCRRDRQGARAAFQGSVIANWQSGDILIGRLHENEH